MTSTTRFTTTLAGTALAAFLCIGSCRPALAEPPETVRVGGGDHFAPYHFIDDQGNPSGFDVELLRAVARVMDLDLEIQLGPWRTMRGRIESGRLDMLIGMSVNEERRERFRFSRPHLRFQYKIFVREDNSKIHDEQDLAGKRIIVQRRGIMEDLVRERDYSVNPVLVDSARAGLQLLAAGREDCYLTGEYRGLHVIRELGIDHIERRGQPLLIADYGYAVRRDLPELAATLDLGLDIIRESGEYNRLVQKWFGVYESGWHAGRTIKLVSLIVAPLLVILAVSLLWTRTLKRKVDRQTRTLKVELSRREQLEDELVQVRKMEAIGKLAGGIAHDFNNLLVVIQGFSEMALESMSEDDPNRRNLEQVLKGSRRAADLTGQMLAFSRRQVLQPKIVDVNRALADIRQMIRRIIGEDIELETRLEPDLGLVRVDPGQFDQVILNIVVNARDAMPGGGKITFRTCNTRLDEPEIPAQAEIEPGTYVLLEIHDTGSGIPQEDLGHIFEPFFTTKEPGKGTGLGLSTVYGIVRQSGGHINVDSEPGAGTAFCIFLPRLDIPKWSEQPDRTADRAHEGTETILVAEDEPEVVDLIEAALHGYGYSVLAASDPELAARIARQHEGRIDLLLSDVVMPGMNGAELAAEVRTSHPEVQVLYISGYTDHPTVLEEIERKGSAFLQKPFSAMVIAAKVREVLDTEAHSPS